MSPWLSDLFLGSQSDERLVTLARAGHERAFVAIVQRYQRPLLAFARRLGADGRAEDVVQQAFLSAFAALRDGTEVKHLRGWLHQIVRNGAAKSALGFSGTHSSAQLEPGTPSPGTLEEAVEHRMLAAEALTEISRLPERQRDALIATALAGRSRSEVADAMGVSEGAVRQLVHRARGAVRAVVTALTPYPVAQWFALSRAAPGGDRVAEIAVGASAGSAGAALKLGAVVVSGVVATGIVVSQPKHHHARGASTSHARVQHMELASTTDSGATRGGALAGSVAQSGAGGSAFAPKAGDSKRGSGRAHGSSDGQRGSDSRGSSGGHDSGGGGGDHAGSSSGTDHGGDPGSAGVTTLSGHDGGGSNHGSSGDGSTSGASTNGSGTGLSDGGATGGALTSDGGGSNTSDGSGTIATTSPRDLADANGGPHGR